jgi:hypothetical protein
MADKKSLILRFIAQLNRCTAFLLAEVKDPILRSKLSDVQRTVAEAQLYAESMKE